METGEKNQEHITKTEDMAREFKLSQVLEVLNRTNIYLFQYFPKLKMCTLMERTVRDFHCKPVYYDMPESFGDEFVLPEDRENYDKLYEKIHAGSETASAEFRSKSGRVWCRVTLQAVEWDENGTAEFCMGTVEDLSDIKNHMHALQRILSSISCGIIQHNQHTNELLTVNEAALEILGYASKEEMAADHFDGVAGTVVPADKEYIKKVIAELKTPEEMRDYEYKVVHKDGKVVHCYGSVQMFYNHFGDCIIQRNIMDITEKVEQSKQLENIMTMHLQMLDSLSCGVFAYTLPERDILILNEEAKRLFHYGEDGEKSFRDSIYAHIVPEDISELAKVAATLREVGDNCRYKYRLQMDGERLVVECATKLLAFRDGSRFILSVMQDVTEKEKTEYMLRRERQQYREAVTANSEFEFAFDVTEGMLHHDVAYQGTATFSEVCHITFPIHYDDFMKAWKNAEKPEFLTPGEENQLTAKDLIIHFEKGQTNVSCEYYLPKFQRYYRRNILLSKDEITGHIMAIVFADDITEVIRENSRERNELAMMNRSLKKQMEITQSFSSLYFASWEINLITEKVFEILVPDWAHDVCDKTKNDYKAACDILIKEFVAEGYKQAVSDFLDMDTLQTRINHEKFLGCEYVGATGTWCAAMLIPSKRDEWGNVTNVIYAVRNVDAEKEKELNAKKALQEAYDFANRASAAKTDFLASMSHDIRTPMNAIVGMTEIARRHTDNKERVEDCLSKIMVSANHLLGLINEVLDMNKIESGTMELVMEDIDLLELVDNLVTISKPQIEKKNHRFSLVMNDIKHGNVIGDSMRIQQVFINLMGNAIKYTPEGGDIRLIVSEKPTNNSRVGCYEFVFEDNGIGMSEEFLQNIYEPFTRAKDSRVEKIQGTGLGMAITKNIVSMMNGDIQIESTLGKGSRFTVTIFLKLQKNKGNAGAASGTGTKQNADNILDAFAKKGFSQKRALLVEDNELNAEIAVEILGMTGIAIEHVNDGRQAVEKLEETEDGYYDIIFMDLQMPVMNGFEAAMAIRALPGDYVKKVPIIAMTANAFAEDVQACKNAGMNEHVAKPLDLKQLFATLDKWVE